MLRYLALGAFLMLFGAALWFYARRTPLPGLSLRNGGQGQGGDSVVPLRLTDLSYVRYQGERVELWLRSPEAYLREDEAVFKGQTEGQRPDLGEGFAAGAVVIKLQGEASLGQDVVAERINFSSGVMMQEKVYLLQSEAMAYTPANDMLFGVRPVALEGDGLKVHAEGGFRLKRAAGIAELLGRVHGLFLPKD